MLNRLTEWFRVVTPIGLFLLSVQIGSIDRQFAKMENKMDIVNNKLEAMTVDLSQRIARAETWIDLQRDTNKRELSQ